MRALPGMQSTFGDLVVISGVFVYCCISSPLRIRFSLLSTNRSASAPCKCLATAIHSHATSYAALRGAGAYSQVMARSPFLRKWAIKSVEEEEN
jgi:hypothetical protein